MHGGRVDRGGDVDEVQVRLARRKRELPYVADEGEARVVDRHGQIGLVVAGGGDLRPVSRGRRNAGADNQSRNGEGENGSRGKESSCVHGNLPGSDQRTGSVRFLAEDEASAIKKDLTLPSCV